jgi:hypothetical protein
MYAIYAAGPTGVAAAVPTPQALQAPGDGHGVEIYSWCLLQAIKKSICIIYIYIYLFMYLCLIYIYIFMFIFIYLFIYFFYVHLHKQIDKYTYRCSIYTSNYICVCNYVDTWAF